MINKLETYAAIGKQSGKCARHKDWIGSSFHNRHVSRMLALEPPEDRRKARQAFDEGYKSESGYSDTPIYFR